MGEYFGGMVVRKGCLDDESCKSVGCALKWEKRLIKYLKRDRNFSRVSHCPEGRFLWDGISWSGGKLFLVVVASRTPKLTIENYLLAKP